LRTINKYAAEYQKKSGKPATFVIDNINKLAKTNVDEMGILQDWAKQHADNRTLHVIFVSSDSAGPKEFMKRSSVSRLRTPIEIPDLSDKEAVSYLEMALEDKSQGVKEPSKIKSLVHGIEVEGLKTLVEQVLGGRFLLLNDAATDLRNGMKLEDVKREILRSAAKEYKTSGLLSNPKPKFGEHIINSLLQSSNQRIPHDMALSTCMNLPTEKEQQKCNNLLDTQVFAYHPSDDTLSFQSRATLAYGREYVKKG